MVLVGMLVQQFGAAAAHRYCPCCSCVVLRAGHGHSHVVAAAGPGWAAELIHSEVETKWESTDASCRLQAGAECRGLLSFIFGEGAALWFR